MEGAFFGIVALIIVGTIVSSLKKGIKDTKRTANNSPQSQSSAPTGGGVDLVSEIKGGVPKVSPNAKKEKAKIEGHPHPATQRPVRTEKAFIENSAGGIQTEGCEEHYFERYVALPEKKQDQELNEELARIMVLGEVLNNPGFKKYGRK
ncbi:MAG: hypothetical protein PHC84_01645 [Clostridia bacterium]|nr:hypothetical protein [Clostridia bacterium]